MYVWCVCVTADLADLASSPPPFSYSSLAPLLLFAFLFFMNTHPNTKTHNNPHTHHQTNVPPSLGLHYHVYVVLPAVRRAVLHPHTHTRTDMHSLPTTQVPISKASDTPSQLTHTNTHTHTHTHSATPHKHKHNHHHHELLRPCLGTCRWLQQPGGILCQGK
jgi:hypothetical protein